MYIERWKVDVEGWKKEWSNVGVNVMYYDENVRCVKDVYCVMGKAGVGTRGE